MRLVLLTSLAAVPLLMPAPTAAAGSANKLYHCPVGNGRGYGYLRLTSLTIKRGEGISCSYARRVATKGSSLQQTFMCVGRVLSIRLTYKVARRTCTAEHGQLWVRFTIWKKSRKHRACEQDTIGVATEAAASTIGERHGGIWEHRRC